MLDLIARPFGMLMLWLYEVTKSYGLAMILFGVIVKVIMLPFMAKSKKGMMRMSRLNPQIQELQKRHGGNQQKLQQEMSKLYKEEHVSPMSGCLWMMIPYPILLALYRAIRFPITIMMGVDKSLIAEGGAIYQKLVSMGYEIGNGAYEQMNMTGFISRNFDQFTGLSDKLRQINYSFLGLDLSMQPDFRIWNFNWGNAAELLPMLGLFLIPVLSGVLSWLSMKISQKTNPSTGVGDAAAQAQQTMKGMNIFMPLFSAYICFVMPAALGVYWAVTYIFGIVQDLILNKVFGKQLDKEDAGRLEREKLRAAEWERRRQETERKKAENATTINENTSKKKLQQQQKAEADAIKAAAIREEREKRRQRLGIEKEEIPDSQVGNRRYARGRAYVADRFTNPAHAAEATAAAAAESESYVAPAEEVEETASTAETEVTEVAETAETVEAVEEKAEEAEEEVTFDDFSEEAPAGEDDN